MDIWLGRTRQQAVIAVSSQLEEALEPLFPGKVHKIFNFIDVNELRDGWLPKPDKQIKEIKLGIAGRLVPVKRIDLFLKTIHLLVQEGIHCKGIILGDGPMADELKDLAHSLQIEQLVEFRGFVYPVAKEMVTLDALLMTSDHEGLPMVLLEALALGIPCIAHNTGGISEILDNGKCGYLVNTQSEASYAQAVNRFLSENQKDIRSRLGKYHIENGFSVTSNAPLYYNIYKSIS
jgi:glycosyltransferase involved in cell wall biosynthesis